MMYIVQGMHSPLRKNTSWHRHMGTTQQAGKTQAECVQSRTQRTRSEGSGDMVQAQAKTGPKNASAITLNRPAQVHSVQHPSLSHPPPSMLNCTQAASVPCIFRVRPLSCLSGATAKSCADQERRHGQRQQSPPLQDQLSHARATMAIGCPSLSMYILSYGGGFVSSSFVCLTAASAGLLFIQCGQLSLTGPWRAHHQRPPPGSPRPAGIHGHQIVIGICRFHR